MLLHGGHIVCPLKWSAFLALGPHPVRVKEQWAGARTSAET